MMLSLTRAISEHLKRCIHNKIHSLLNLLTYFTKEMSEHACRHAGIIIRYTESLPWQRKVRWCR